MEENNMTTTMRFPIIQSQQVGSISALQSNSQQTGGLDMSNILNLMLPAIVVGMMVKMTSSMGKPNQ
jgi:hemolysin-activating ACP:hemolysin acyltransferase